MPEGAESADRRWSMAEIEKMNKPELKAALIESLKQRSDPPAGDDIKSLLLMQIEETKKINVNLEKLHNRMIGMEQQVHALTQENSALKKTVANQQYFLEDLDRQQRECNVIVLGLKECDDELGSNDEQKMTKVTEIIGLPSVLEGCNLKRLGKQEQGRNRALLIRCPNPEKSNAIRKEANKLGTYKGPEQDLIKKVYIKRDIHPAWRKEHDRLRKLAKEESKKPINAGHDIKYDAKEGVVTCDGIVIDRFCPQHFRVSNK